MNTTPMKSRSMQLSKFESGTFIELEDTMKGFRKLGLVADNGTMYYDEASDTATPFPIYEALLPVAIGNSLSWGLELASKDKREHNQYSELQQKLIDSGIDTITLARSLFWAYKNHTYDFARALAAGKAATADVMASREMLDRIRAKGEAA
jgi:hypothetical protein